ncbi:MAG: hypothetical protein AAGC46_16730 [Solirubrobacteraceae bacterium]
MLFDTSSPGRRRGVQIIFAFLAILMGGGLVLFGIGSSSTQGGGLLDNIGKGGTDVISQAQKDASKAQDQLQANPKNVAAAASYAKAEVTIATGRSFDANGQATGKNSANDIATADAAWTQYLALAPAKPDSSTATLYAAFYALPGVGKYDKAARALEAALVTRTPTAGLYAQLAFDWLVAGDKTKYNEARTKSLALSDNDTRKTAIAKQLDDVEKQVDDYYKAQAKAAAAQKGSSSGGTASTTPKLPTLPSLAGN